MFPLSTFYSQESELWLRNHPGRQITIRQVGLLFGKAYMRAATPKNAISGFENTGIWPFNPSIFPEEAIVASKTTDRPDPTNPPANTESTRAAVNITNTSHHNGSEKEHVDINSSSDEDDVPLMTLKNLIATKPVSFEKQIASNSKNITAEPTAGCSKDMFAESVASCSKVVPKPVTDSSKNMSCTEFVVCEIGEDTTGSDIGFGVLENPVEEIITSGRESGSFCSPRDIIPIPECSQNITEQKPRRTRGKIAVITSSPYYLELKEKNRAIPVKVVAPVKRNVFGGKEKGKAPLKKKVKRNVKREGDGLDKTQKTDNVESIMCGGYYYDSKHREVWICCSICKEWAHERCISYEKKEGKPYVCDICM